MSCAKHGTFAGRPRYLGLSLSPARTQKGDYRSTRSADARGLGFYRTPDTTSDFLRTEEKTMDLQNFVRERLAHMSIMVGCSLENEALPRASFSFSCILIRYGSRPDSTRDSAK